MKFDHVNVILRGCRKGSDHETLRLTPQNPDPVGSEVAFKKAADAMGCGPHSLHREQVQLSERRNRPFEVVPALSSQLPVPRGYRCKNPSCARPMAYDATSVNVKCGHCGRDHHWLGMPGVNLLLEDGVAPEPTPEVLAVLFPNRG